MPATMAKRCSSSWSRLERRSSCCAASAPSCRRSKSLSWQPCCRTRLPRWFQTPAISWFASVPTTSPSGLPRSFWDRRTASPWNQPAGSAVWIAYLACVRSIFEGPETSGQRANCRSPRRSRSHYDSEGRYISEPPADPCTERDAEPSASVRLAGDFCKEDVGGTVPAFGLRHDINRGKSIGQTDQAHVVTDERPEARGGRRAQIEGPRGVAFGPMRAPIA